MYQVIVKEKKEKEKTNYIKFDKICYGHGQSLNVHCYRAEKIVTKIWDDV